MSDHDNFTLVGCQLNSWILTVVGYTQACSGLLAFC